MYWRNHAIARRSQYAAFMESVGRDGVNEAYKQAIIGYTALPMLDEEARRQDAELAGREQAFHLFFDLLGVDRKTTIHLQTKRKRPRRRRSQSIVTPQVADTVSLRKTAEKPTTGDISACQKTS